MSVDCSPIVGHTAQIGEYVVIEAGTVVGAGCVVQHHAVIGKGVVVRML